MSLNLFRKKYSKFQEQFLIQEYLKQITTPNQYVVDIGAADGLKMSNTYHLFKNLHPGLVIESNAKKFQELERNYANLSEVKKLCEKVTPDSISQLLIEQEVPENFLLLSLDIDGYDYDVLESLLATHRPALIVSEINESIPPPIRFKVKYDPEFVWKGGHFFGYSIACLSDLLSTFDYSLVELHYNNVFLIANHYWKKGSRPIEAAYADGYRDKPGRKRKFKYNQPMEPLHSMPPEESMAFLDRYFQDHRGKYELSGQ